MWLLGSITKSRRTAPGVLVRAADRFCRLQGPSSVALGAGLLLIGCADGDLPATYRGCGWQSRSISVTTGAYPSVAIEGSACRAAMRRERESLGVHVPDCSTIQYATNPPSSGQHYGSWAPFQVFDEPIGRGFWVHSIEHGAVVILYSCRDCDAEIRAAKVMIEALPEDPVCVGMRRIILVPDPLLDVAWAAAGWGYTLRSDCFEPEVFRDFALRFAGHGPEEEVCTQGTARP